MVIVVSGPGGVGKGTIAEYLVKKLDNLWLSKSWTTRKVRSEEDEDSYVFVSRKEFEKAIGDNRFLEWTEFHGNLYGTPLPEAPDGFDVLLEIDVNGALSVVEQSIEALLIFVDAPSVEDQERRLRGRGDPEDEVRRRILEGEKERQIASDLGAIIVINDDLERTIEEISSLINANR
ncbi:MAG: guanylate kinase [Acidimicrobiales bacterium]|jgi:guanylate kinase|nr:guanylate kinase [Acidimicrobiales bacterium]MDP6298648.1 guanylate kinase [Acidimicrobiales bacterium]HJM28872.1 guanylate kinase [Acidimicrobiales bacterium]HJM97892.1 guanylate kinase [Acidimicrobiales bacterium]